MAWTCLGANFTLGSGQRNGVNADCRFHRWLPRIEPVVDAAGSLEDNESYTGREGQSMAGSKPEKSNVRASERKISHRPDQPSPADHRVQVAAARLRVTLDRRLGRDTPSKTAALAREDF